MEIRFADHQPIYPEPYIIVKYSLPLLLIITLLAGLSSCTQKSEYEQLVDRELGSGLQKDSLFLGYYFGMTQDSFLDHSWNLNRDQVITGGAKINYKPEGLKAGATMDFYPQFQNQRIYRLPIDVYYDGWAPWNTHLQSDSLITDLKEFYKSQYNADFIIHTFDGDETPSYVSVQANRQIKITRIDARIAKVEFLDLNVVNGRSE
jgi:hypothetical protein